MRKILIVVACLAAVSSSRAGDVLKPIYEGEVVLKDFRFGSGEVLAEVRMHYRTWGKARRDAKGTVQNAVLILHGTTGSGEGFVKKEFAGELFGKGQPLDAEQYYIIIPDSLGHGQSTRPSSGMRAKFPRYNYHDMIHAQHRMLTEGLKVDHLRLVMGTSMGGMHTWLWGEVHPDFMDALMPLASLPAQIAGRNRVWRKTISDGIRNDPAWQDGNYKSQPPSLQTAAEIMFFMSGNPTRRQNEAPTRDQADKMLAVAVQKVLKTKDANDVLYALEASRDYDPGPDLGKIKAPLLAINFADDLINPPELGILEKAIKNVPRGRALVFPQSDQTNGHQTHTLAAVWKTHLAELLRSGAALPATRDEPTTEPNKSVVASLKPFVDNHSLAGAVVLVADKDKVLCHEAIGYADVSADTRMLLDALFWIASESKPITAFALMMLLDEGKLRLDDPVEKYLPEFKGQWLAVEQDKDHVLLKKPRHPITIREILSHTSGMPFQSAMERPTLDGLALRDAVRSYAITPLQFEPGSKYQYSNAGINTAGRIIEVISGMPYEDFLEKRLFGPLGMKDTTFWPNEEQLKRLAKSYRPNKAGTGLDETTIGQLQYPLSDRKRQPMPAGGLFSTASDVGRFCQMVLAGGTYKGKRYLSEASVKEMTKKQTGEGITDGYGLGWSTGGGTFGHGGEFATNMTIDSQKGLITIFMVQHAGFPGNGAQSHAAFRKAALKRFGQK